MDATLLALFVERLTQTFALEALTPLLTVYSLLAIFQNLDPYFFVDNEAAVSTFIRGSSRAADVAAAAEIWHFLCARISCRAWVERIHEPPWLGGCMDSLPRLANCGRCYATDFLVAVVSLLLSCLCTM